MIFTLSSLRSRFGWRVFRLFLLAALVPIVVTGALVFSQVTRLLTDQANSQLHQVAKSYGLQLLSRFEDVAQALVDVHPSIIQASVLNRAELDYLHKKINSLALIQADGRMVSMLGPLPEISAAELTGFNPDRVGIYTRLNQRGEHEIFLVRTLLDPAGRKIHQIAAVDQDYLWGSSDVFPYGVTLSVLDHQGDSLYSSGDLAAMNAGITEARTSNAVPINPAEKSAEENIHYEWDIFLSSVFDSQSWTVQVQQPKSQALAAISSFKAIFPAVLILTVLIVTLLSVSQIRRQLVPLEKIIYATRRITEWDFSQRVVVKSSDEFQELAESFNSMASRLGRQFDFMNTLSDIDRSILSMVDIDAVLESVISRIHSMINCDAASIAIFDSMLGEDTDLYVGRCFCTFSQSIRRVSWQSEDLQFLFYRQDMVKIDAVQAAVILSEDFLQSSMNDLYVFPIFIEQQLFGFLTLGYRTAVFNEEEHRHARDLADRFAVALAAAKHQDKLYLQAHFDSLTGLPNRHLLSDRLGQEIAHAKRDNYMLAILFLDLDRFKNVNDVSGHGAGDKLLMEAARRLNEVTSSNTVARLGGDEFVIILSGQIDLEYVKACAERIIEVMGKPFKIDNSDHFISASIGITFYPDGGDSVTELFRSADMAMYKAKESGRGCYQFYDEYMNKTVQERNLLERDLRQAMERREFILHYQPQVDSVTGQVMGAEALIRWNHPQRGMVSPGHFIPIAEETGYIDVLGAWVLQSACEQLRVWQSRGINLNKIAVNVASRQFAQEHFVDSVQAVLNTTGIAPRSLELEITESTLMDNKDDTLQILHQLQAMGVKLSIDDFGTGYSSLAYLKRFPINTLKIDRTFIMDIQQDEDARAITASIIAMAKAMGKQVVAEGVETDAQLAFLAQHRCHLIQGYYYSPALPAEEFEAYLLCSSVYPKAIQS